MKLIYNVSDKPTFGKLIIFALQQLFERRDLAQFSSVNDRHMPP